MISSTFIDKHCLTIKGGLNNRVCLKSWWENRNLISIYDSIFTQTSFLPKNSSVSERLYYIKHGITEPPVCQHCKSNPVSFKNYSDGHYDYCSAYCSTQCPERNRKIVENRDNEKMKETYKKTCMERYGVEFWFKTKQAVDAIKNTKKEKYGDEKYNNVEKAKKTNLERYGVEYSCLAECSKKKAKDTITKRRPQLFDAEWLTETNKTKTLKEMARDLGVTYRTVWLAFDRLDIEPIFYNPKYNKLEKEIGAYVREDLGIDILMNDRTLIKPKEIDVYSPEHRVGIELNGTYWHSFDSPPNKKEMNRHFTKKILCDNVGITLIQIWDDEWLYKKPLCKDLFRRALNKTENILSVDDTVVVDLDVESYSAFLETNHIQGVKAATIRLALIHKANSEILAVMGFNKHKRHGYDLVQFCQKVNTHVEGGIEKLFDSFLIDVNPKSVVSHCDRRLYTGKIFESLGFVKNGDKANLDYCWVKRNLRYDKSLFSKEDLVPNMYDDGYRKLYDCGKEVWCYNE